MSGVGPAGFCYSIVALTLSLGPLPVISHIKVNKVVNLFRCKSSAIRNPGILDNEEKPERIESLVRVWQGMKDEMEKDEMEKDGADAKAVEKKEGRRNKQGQEE